MPVHVSRTVILATAMSISCGCFADTPEAAATEGDSDGASSEDSGGDGGSGTLPGSTGSTGSGDSGGESRGTDDESGSEEEGGSSSTGSGPVDADRDGFDDTVDCDDTDPLVNPDATETCDLVDNDCDDIVDFGLSVPTHFETIGEAIDAAFPGDHICVGPGTYAEALVIGSRITLESTDGSAATTVAPAGDSRVLAIADTEDVRIQGFTLSGGVAANGAGIQVDEASGIHLEDVVLRDHAGLNPGAACQGIAMRALDSELTVHRMLVFDNATEDCRYAGGVVYVNNSTAALSNVSVLANSQSPVESVNAAIQIIDSNTDITNLIVAGNTMSANVNGYASALQYNGEGVHTLTNATIARNSVQAQFIRNGAVRFNGNGAAPLVVDLVNVTTSHNEGGPNPGYGQEGAVSLTLQHSNAYANDPSSFGPNVTDPTGVDGNIALDPGFVDTSALDPMNWDLTLVAGSALVNAGDPDLLDPDGSTSDIGAFGGPGANAW